MIDPSAALAAMMDPNAATHRKINAALVNRMEAETIGYQSEKIDEIRTRVTSNATPSAIEKEFNDIQIAMAKKLKELK